MKRVRMVQEGAQDLLDTEEAVVTALTMVGNLPDRLHRLRRENKLSMVIARDTIHNIGRTFSAMVEAHSSIIEVHASLDDVKTMVGCRTVASGTGVDKPPPPPEGVSNAPLALRPVEQDGHVA